jgi:Peptidase family M23
MKSMKHLWKLACLGMVIALIFFVARPPASRPFDPAFLRLSPLQIVRLPLATRFDQPMGSEHGALTYNAQPFRLNRHLGDDLNGIGGLNSDLGDAVYAAGFGRVVYAGTPAPSWGKMIILAHRVRDLEHPEKTRVIQTVYAHLDQISVQQEQLVQRGGKIGTVGNADGQYLAHLHFEIREGPYINPSLGYADAPLNRLSPERFLAQYRGAPEDQLNPAPALPAQTGP